MKAALSQVMCVLGENCAGVNSQLTQSLSTVEGIEQVSAQDLSSVSVPQAVKLDLRQPNFYAETHTSGPYTVGISPSDHGTTTENASAVDSLPAPESNNGRSVIIVLALLAVVALAIILVSLRPR